MLLNRTSAKSSKMHEIAVERLRKAESARTEYVRNRFNDSVSKTFDAWDSTPTSEAEKSTRAG